MRPTSVLLLPTPTTPSAWRSDRQLVVLSVTATIGPIRRLDLVGPVRQVSLYDNNFLTLFFSGLTIGIEDNAGPKHDATWTATTTGRSNLKTYLTSSAGVANTALTADTDNATSTSGGSLPRQAAALALNVGFNAAGVTDALNHNLGSLTDHSATEALSADGLSTQPRPQR